MRASLVFVIFLGLSSCSFFQNEDKIHLASIYGNDLFYEDIEYSFINESSKEDSLLLLNSLIEKWVKKQTLIHKAELNLDEELIDIEKQVLDYKNALLIYKYQKLLVDQKLDTVISDLDIQNYYIENKSNFKVKNNFVQVNYVKVKKEVPSLYKLLKWYKSSSTEDLDLLEELNFKLPKEISQRDFRNKKYFELKDEDYYFFVCIKNKKGKGEISPLELEKDQIKSILINKRKIDFLRNMENQLYKEALSKKLIKYEKE